MNPAKAAPSAPVKKAVREDPQILPDGLLILPTAGPCCSNPSRSQSQRLTYVHTKEKQQR